MNAPHKQTWDATTVRRASTDVVIVSAAGVDAPVPDHGVSVPVDGGYLVVDMTRLEVPPRAVLYDPTQAQVWLSGVYGDDVAEAVGAFAELGDPAVPAPIEALATKDYLSNAMLQRARGYFLFRHGVGFDLRDLKIELAGLAWYAEASLQDTVLVSELLGGNLGRLVQLVESAHARLTGRAYVSTMATLTRSLRAAVELCDPGEDSYDECVELLADWDAQDRAVLAAMAEEVETFLRFVQVERDLVRVPELVAALVGEPQSAEAVEHVGTTDWLHHPARLLSLARNNKWWSLEPLDGGRSRFTVRLLGPDLPVPADASLTVRGLADGVAFSCPLAYVTSLNQWRAELVLDSVPAHLVWEPTDLAHALPFRDEEAVLAGRDTITKILDECREASSRQVFNGDGDGLYPEPLMVERGTA